MRDDSLLSIGLALGRLEAAKLDHDRRLSKLEERPQEASIPWAQLLPYLYGLAMVIAALIAVASGKVSAADIVREIGAKLLG